MDTDESFSKELSKQEKLHAEEGRIEREKQAVIAKKMAIFRELCHGIKESLKKDKRTRRFRIETDYNDDPKVYILSDDENQSEKLVITYSVSEANMKLPEYYWIYRDPPSFSDLKYESHQRNTPQEMVEFVIEVLAFMTVRGWSAGIYHFFGSR